LERKGDMQVNGDLMFVHVPKTGGESVTQVLNPHTNYMFDQHDTLFRAFRAEPETFVTRYRFGFVRNPFDREVSNYFWHTKQNDKVDIEFGDWIKWRYGENTKILAYKNFKDPDTYWYHKGFGRNPQVGFFVNPAGDWLHNFIGRFETLQEDWEVIANKFNLQKKLPYAQKTERDADYRIYYTDELVDIVAEAHKADLIAFNYDFEHGMLSKEINKSVRPKIHLHYNYNYYYG